MLNVAVYNLSGFTNNEMLFQDRNLDWFPRMQAISLEEENAESEQPEACFVH